MDSHQLFLHAAATGDIASMEQEYLKNKAVLTGKDSDNRTALHLAVLNGHLKAVERLLDYGIAWCPKDNQGQTALHLAAQLSSATIAETLLERGANCCTQDHDGKTPVFYAYQNYSPDVTRIAASRHRSFSEAAAANGLPSTLNEAARPLNIARLYGVGSENSLFLRHSNPISEKMHVRSRLRPPRVSSHLGKSILNSAGDCLFSTIE
ncbi:serine/threonine-protein [Aspergillus flavus AF70]|nr:serine/threonine-protein [Aspergillus flavus AF70]